MEINDKLNIEKLDSIKQPFVVYYQSSASLEKINKEIYISPFLNEYITDNPFNQSSRTYPIDLEYKKSRLYYSTIIIPKGYAITKLPENLDFNNNMIEFKYEIVKINDQALIISSILKLKQMIYPADNYLKLKSFYDLIIKKQNERIVLQKI